MVSPSVTEEEVALLVAEIRSTPADPTRTFRERVPTITSSPKPPIAFSTFVLTKSFSFCSPSFALESLRAMLTLFERVA